MADGRKLTVLGSLPVNITVRDGPHHDSKQLLHIVEELNTLFIGRGCLQDLGIISSSFPLPQEDLIVQALDHHASPVEEPNHRLAPCGCPRRTPVPDPPDIPFEPKEENVPKLKQYLIDYYSTSTMNLCSHQKLPEVSGPPLHFTLKPDAVPVAVHTPATVPIHWFNEVKNQLDRDVTMGILEVVPPNEPTKWQHRMVVVRKHNGKPRRTVDMQALNKATLRSSHPLTSPFQKAMTVPAGTYKTVTDAHGAVAPSFTYLSLATAH